MGIPTGPILEEKLNEINEELNERFNSSIQFVRSDGKYQSDGKFRIKKPSVLLEYFVLYNSLLAFEPDEIIKMNLKKRGGAPFMIPGKDCNKTIRKYGETNLEPSIVIRKGGKEINFWFDRPFIYFDGKSATLRPDIIIRKGKFEFKDLSNLIYQKEGKVQLLKDGELFAEFGILSPSVHEDKEYQLRISNKLFDKLFGHKIYFKFKDEFIHPPIAIEAKGYGGVMGNLEEYPNFAKHVILVTFEKTYEPKKENLYILRLENKKRVSNSEPRKKLQKFYSQVGLI